MTNNCYYAIISEKVAGFWRKNLDTQEFLDTVKIWTDSYRETRDPDKEHTVGESPEEIKWEESMLKIAAVLLPAESIKGTPAMEKINMVKDIASKKDRSKLQEIYKLLHEVEEYLKSSL